MICGTSSLAHKTNQAISARSSQVTYQACSPFSSRVSEDLEDHDDHQLREAFIKARLEIIRSKGERNSVYYRNPSQIKGDVRGIGNLGPGDDITQLKKRSIFIAYELSRRTGFSEVDLHGFFLDEAQELVIIIIDQVLDSLYNQKGKSRAVLQIITGRGNHSQGSPVLHPKLKAFLLSEGYETKSTRNESVLCVTIVK